MTEQTTSTTTGADNGNDATDTDNTTNDEWVPPTKEQWDALLARESKASAEAASRKRWLREVGINPKTGEKLTDDDVRDETGAANTGTQAAANKPAHVDTGAIEKAVATKTEAVFVALAEAGVGPKSLTRVSKMIDKTAITIGEDGIHGLSDQIDALKEELPELFKRSRATNVADASAVGAGNKQTPSADTTKDYRQKLAETILGR